MPRKQHPRRGHAEEVFEDSTGKRNDYLITNATVDQKKPGLRQQAQWTKLRDLTVQDLFHLIGFRDNNDDLSDRVKKLALEDIHTLGELWSAHTGMNYPNKVYSCCCCG